MSIQLNQNLGRKAPNKKSILRKMIIISVSFAFLFCIVRGSIYLVKADAPTSISVKVDYTDETVIIPSANSQSTKFYMSTDEKKTWELIDSSISATNKIDISGLLSTKEKNIYFKGNKDTTPAQVVLQAEDKSLKPVYKRIQVATPSGPTYKGCIEFTAGNRKVQYRKGTNGTWIDATSPMDTSMYEIKGTTLYFRYAPTQDLRAGKVVTVRVQKRPSAPSVRFDGSKLCLTGLKSGKTQYRVGDSTEWITFTSDTKANYISLTALPGVSLTANGTLPNITVEFRTPATEKKVASASKVIEIPEQPMITSTVTLNFTTLSVNDPDPKRAYEYTVPNPFTTFDITKARWTTFTSKKAVQLKNVALGSEVYVRLKSTTDKTTKQIIPASAYVKYIVAQATY